MAKLKAKSFQNTGQNLQMQITITGMSLVLERDEKKTLLDVLQLYESQDCCFKHRGEELS